MIWWDEAAGEMDRQRRAGFRADQAARLCAPTGASSRTAWTRIGGDDPFIMEADGKCHAVRALRAEGRPAADVLRAGGKPGARTRCIGQQINPAAKLWARPGNELHEPQDPRFPYVFTTYRLTELHCGGISTRVTPHTAELQPEAFVEISPELADELGITQPGLDSPVHGCAARSK